MTTVAVLIPSTGRPEQLQRNAAALVQQGPLSGVWLMVVMAIPSDDTASIEAARRVTLMKTPHTTRAWIALRKPGTTAVEGWNPPYEYVDSICQPDWFVLGADDVVWHEGWLAAALRVAGRGVQVIGLNDGGHTDLAQYAPHYMAHRNFTEAILDGHIAPEPYRSWWFDRHVCELAQQLGVYAPAWDAIAEHQHPDWNAAAVDDTYRAGMNWRETDKALYLDWRKRVSQGA
jgi:hypothetical protein